jgi:hypothetical protein
MIKFLKALHKNEDGLSLSEVLVAVGLSGLIALGCAQIALASFNSAKYVQIKTLNTVNTATLNHTIAADMEQASSFVVHSNSAAKACTSQYSIGTVASDVKPLITINYADGSAIGYEVRNTNSEGSFWRVACGANGAQNGSSMLLRRGLPDLNSTLWNEAVKCVNYPAGGNLVSSACPTNQILDSIIQNPGFMFTVPKTISTDVAQYPSQVVLAARNSA